MRDSCIFYRSFFEAIKELPKENQADVYNAIFEYSLNFNDVELNGISKTIMTLIKPQLDANIKRFENGNKPKTKQEKSIIEAKYKQNISKIEANNNYNENENENKNENENENNNENLINKKLNKNDIFLNELLSSQIWLESVAMKSKNKFSIVEVKSKIKDFNDTINNQFDFKENKKEYCTHFTRWLDKQEKEKTNTNDYNEQMKRF